MSVRRITDSVAAPAALVAALWMSGCSNESDATGDPWPNSMQPRGEWPGRFGRSGVNGDPSIDRASVEAFCDSRGRDCAVAHVYTDRRDWHSMTRSNSWLYENFAGFPGQLVISQGLVPDGGEEEAHGDLPQEPGWTNPDLAACAAGDYDEHWRDFGAQMVEHDRASSVVRLGWEFNGTFTPWAATDADVWKACFRHVALAIRSTNPEALFDWTVNAHETPAETCAGSSANCYPGDDVVDVIGIDNYDQGPSAMSEHEFARIAAAPEGLDAVHAFAKLHGKPISIGEWGIAPASEDNTTGENPAFIRWMHGWFAAHAEDIAYEMYFTACDSVGSNLYRPLGPGCSRRNAAAARVYASLFGQ